MCKVFVDKSALTISTMRQQLVHPKDPTPRKRNAGWSTEFSVRIRLEEHDNIRRASTTVVGDHLRDTGHTLDFSSSLIIAIMNRDNGHEPPVIYRDVLSRVFHHPKSPDKTSTFIT